MSKTYRGWAEIDDWSHREVRRQHKRKAKQDWKKEVKEEMAEQTMTAHLVVNAWTPIGLDVELTETVYASFSEQDAWEVLDNLAHDRGVDLSLSDTSFDNPSPDSETDYESWYIETLEVHSGVVQ